MGHFLLSSNRTLTSQVSTSPTTNSHVHFLSGAPVLLQGQESAPLASIPLRPISVVHTVMMVAKRSSRTFVIPSPVPILLVSLFVDQLPSLLVLNVPLSLDPLLIGIILSFPSPSTIDPFFFSFFSFSLILVIKESFRWMRETCMISLRSLFLEGSEEGLLFGFGEADSTSPQISDDGRGRDHRSWNGNGLQDLRKSIHRHIAIPITSREQDHVSSILLGFFSFFFSFFFLFFFKWDLTLWPPT